MVIFQLSFLIICICDDFSFSLVYLMRCHYFFQWTSIFVHLWFLQFSIFQLINIWFYNFFNYFSFGLFFILFPYLFCWVIHLVWLFNFVIIGIFIIFLWYCFCSSPLLLITRNSPIFALYFYFDQRVIHYDVLKLFFQVERSFLKQLLLIFTFITL